MHFRFPVRSTVAAALVLSGTCAAGAARVGHLGAFAASKVPATVFVSSFSTSQIVEFPANVNDPSPSAYLTLPPSASAYGLAVDEAGTLYAQTNQNTILEYPLGATQPSKTLVEPPENGYGTGVTVTVGHNGTVFSADLYGSTVFEFAGGALKPTTTLSVLYPFGLAVDPHENLYVGYSTGSDGGPGHVLRIPRGATQGKDLGIDVVYSGGIALAKNGDLLVGDQGTQYIYVFHRGDSSPYRSIDTAPNYPYQFAFDSTDKYLYLSPGASDDVVIYDYRSGAVVGSITQGLGAYLGGVALSPAPHTD